MKRISQTVTDEAYFIYQNLPNKISGVSAALLALHYAEIPSEIFKYLYTGDVSVLEGLKRVNKPQVIPKGIKRDKVHLEEVEGTIASPKAINQSAIVSNKSKEPVVILEESIDEDDYVIFDPFKQIG